MSCLVILILASTRLKVHQHVFSAFFTPCVSVVLNFLCWCENVGFLGSIDLSGCCASVNVTMWNIAVKCEDTYTVEFASSNPKSNPGDGIG